MKRGDRYNIDAKVAHLAAVSCNSSGLVGTTPGRRT